MRRSSRPPRARRNAWRRTANGSGRGTTTDLVAVPDSDGQLSEGLLVEATLVARLLRVRLLAIDARLIVAPAQVRDPTPVASAAPRTRAHPVGTRLATAERLLADS
jgi:hypothetical protein